jgi:hypothetical protein
MFLPRRVSEGVMQLRQRPGRAGEMRGILDSCQLRNQAVTFSVFSCSATAQQGHTSRVVEFDMAPTIRTVFIRQYSRQTGRGTVREPAVRSHSQGPNEGSLPEAQDGPPPRPGTGFSRRENWRQPRQQTLPVSGTAAERVSCRDWAKENSTVHSQGELHTCIRGWYVHGNRVDASAQVVAFERGLPRSAANGSGVVCGGQQPACRSCGQRQATGVMELPKGSNAVIGKTSVTVRPRTRYQLGSFSGRMGSPMPTSQSMTGARCSVQRTGAHVLGNQPTILQNMNQNGTQNMFQMMMAQQIAMQEMMRQVASPGLSQAPMQLSGSTPGAPVPTASSQQSFPPNAQPDPVTPAPAGTSQSTLPGDSAGSVNNADQFMQWLEQQEKQTQAVTQAASLRKEEARPRWSTKEGRLGRPKLWAPEDAWESATETGTPKLKGRTACYAQLRYDWASAYLQGFPESDMGTCTLPLDEQPSHSARLLVIGVSALEASTMAKDEGCAVVLKAKHAKRGDLLATLSGILWDDFTEIDFADFRQVMQQFCSERGIPICTRWETMHREQDEAMREAEMEARISQEVQRRIQEVLKAETATSGAASCLHTQSTDVTPTTVHRNPPASMLTPTFPDPVTQTPEKSNESPPTPEQDGPVPGRALSSAPSSTTASYTENPAQPTRKWQKGLPKDPSTDRSWAALAGNHRAVSPAPASLPSTLDEPMPQPARTRRPAIRGGSAASRVRSSSNRSRVNPYGTRSASRQQNPEPEPAAQPIAMGDGAGFAISDDEDL